MEANSFVSDTYRPIVRWMAEGAVIVVSILAAFALDASWDAWQDRKAEATHLSSLQRDFEETRTRISAIMTTEREAQQLATALLDSRVPSDELDSALFRVLATPTFEPVTVTLDELIASGQLTLIEDEVLRGALAAWPSRVERHQRRESWALDNWNNLGAPYAMRELSLPQIAGGALDGAPQVIYPKDHTAILTDPYFHNIVTLRWIAATDALETLQVVMEDCELILRRLEEVLQQQ